MFSQSDACSSVEFGLLAADHRACLPSAQIEQHWTEKAREDMTERDWRIFREDHNISYKGSLDKSCLPIRSWDEANLPKALLQACITVPAPTSVPHPHNPSTPPQLLPDLGHTKPPAGLLVSYSLCLPAVEPPLCDQMLSCCKSTCHAPQRISVRMLIFCDHQGMKVVSFVRP